MRVNFVTVQSGWILQKISERTGKAMANLGHEVTVGHNPLLGVDVNYYVDIQNCWRGYRTTCDIGFFTHADMNSEHWLKELFNVTKAWGLDGIVTQNRRYQEMLHKIGIPKEKTLNSIPAEPTMYFPLKKIVLGIVGRGGYPGQGQQFMEDLLKAYPFTHFKLKILGSNWPNLERIAKEQGIDFEHIQNEDYSKYPDFYHSLDYLLIPNLWTAGPVAIQEALSCGIPIIGADVGFVNYEFPADYTFPPGDLEELIRILEEIQEPRLRRRKTVEGLSWEKHASELLTFFGEIRDTINR